MTRAVTLAEIAAEEVLSVDTTNSRIGIGSTQPTVKLDVNGVVVATAFTGDGTGLTGVANTAIINSNQLNVIGVATASSFVGNITGNVTGNASGTAGGLTGTPDITVRNITGVAATFSGVLTYDDVTNVDSIGIITARSDVSIADKIIHTGDTNTAIRFPAADTFTVETGGSERLRVNSSGNIGINTDDPGRLLTLFAPSSDPFLSLKSGTSNTPGILFGDTASDSIGQIRYYNNGNALTFETNGAEAIRIDSSQRLLVNTATTRNNYDNGSVTSNLLHVERTAASGNAGISICANAATAADAGAILYMGRTKATSNGSTNAVADDDLIGRISFQGADGSELVEAASIRVNVDETPGSNDMPGRLEFHTTADGAAGATERLRIDSSGRMLIGASSPVSGADTNGLLQVSQDVGSNTCIIVAENTASSGNLSCFRARLRNSAPNSIFSAFLQCDDTSGSKAIIRSNGGLANFQSNNVDLSDRNVKKDITAAAGAWNSIKNWEIVNFRYKEQPDDADLNLGVIAQQIEEISPEMVTIYQEAKEATESEPAIEQRLGVKQQQMQWAATKALQEAMTRIETLEARLTALEGS